jgi:elongation factor 1-gamma
VFARDAQLYLLSLMSGTVSPEAHARARDGFAVYVAGIDQALAPDCEFLVGDTVTLADICFVAELCLFFNEKKSIRKLEQQGLAPILHATVDTEFPRAFAHFARLRRHPAFAPDVEPYLAKLATASK